MIELNNISLEFPYKKLFENINIKFIGGNCYGVIGANGAGKSTLLKILAGELEPTSGYVLLSSNTRMAVLKQNHFEFDEYKVIDTVIMGHKRLYEIMKLKDEIYNKENFTEKDGIIVGELELEFADLNGWEAESEASRLLTSLGIDIALFSKQMKEINNRDKVKVLLAQSLFANPDILIMDEPTNDLDFKTINWLENFLIDYDKTVIVVSHDRHFLNKVCTHMVDIDYKTAKLYPGNYDFWYQSSQLALQLAKDANKKKEKRIQELETFIARFQANASKSKQATSRKKSLEKIVLEDIQPSTRKYPYLNFTLNKQLGRDVLTIENLSKKVNEDLYLDNISFTLNPEDKVVVLSDDEVLKTLFLKLIAGEEQLDLGTIKWGSTVEYDSLFQDNEKYFQTDKNLLQWLSNYSDDQSENYLRGFLGRMLFSGEDPLKSVKVLSGGEKIRSLFSKLMIKGSNFLILEHPTNHLDLEAIQALNDGLIKYKGCLIFTSNDHSFIDSIANKVIYLSKDEFIIKEIKFNEFLKKYK